MTLFAQIQADWKEAFKNRETTKKNILNYVLSQLKNKKIELGREPNDNETLKLIQKEVKLREESIAMLQKAGQDEEVELEKERITVLQVYMPSMLSDEALKKAVEEQIQKQGIEDLHKQRGQVIGGVMKQYGAQVDGWRLNQIISSMT